VLRFHARQILELALHATGAERAYWISPPEPGSGEPGRVELCCSARCDGQERPSRSVLRLALSAPAEVLFLDAATDERLAAGGSVRSLALRSVVCAPLTVAGAPAGALVLDSRQRPRRAVERLRPTLCGLARTFAWMVERAGDLGAPSPWPPDAGDEPVASSPVFRAAVAWVDRVAPTPLPVLIEGETGSGKDGLARRLHRRSRRAARPLLAVNCAAFTESLLDAELFGAVRGAYTGADRDRPGLFRLASGGTLFLDEVGDMGPAMQAKLLRALETRCVRPVGGEQEEPVDVRVVAATHHDLEYRVAQGAFRVDLFHRLAVLRVRVPPLRERPEDLAPLVAALAPRLERETGLGPVRLSRAAWLALHEHPWPGNVRELHAVLASALLRAGGEEIGVGDLRLDSAPGCNGGPRDDSIERRMIVAALRGARGSVTRAAGELGWSRQKFYRRMRAHGIVVAPLKRGAQDPGTRSSESSTFQ